MYAAGGDNFPEVLPRASSSLGAARGCIDGRCRAVQACRIAQLKIPKIARRLRAKTNERRERRRA